MCAFAEVRKGCPALLLGCLLGGLAQAQSTQPSPVITSLHPPGGRPGTTVEVTLKGADLSGPVTLHLLPEPKTPVVATPKLDAKKNPEPGKFTLELPGDLEPGLYDLRFVGDLGVSNPRTFQVSPLETLESSGNNTTSDQAAEVALNTVLQGTFKSTAPHWFRFQAKAGQRVLAVFQSGVFSSRIQGVGSVYDEAGQELARLRDGLLSFTAPAEGAYHLKFHDLMHGSGDEFNYRLTLTTGPVVFCVAGAQVYGWNLPDGQVMEDHFVTAGPPLEKVKINGEDTPPWVRESPKALVQIPLSLTDFDDQSTESGPELTVGAGVAGWFPANGSALTFDLPFEAGQRFVIELMSHQLGFRSDPLMVIETVKRDDKGVETVALQAEANDGANPPIPTSVKVLQLDPAYAFSPTAAGRFRISVSDPLNAANGRRLPFVLRVRSTEETATLSATALAVTNPEPIAAAARLINIAGANLWQAGTLAVEVRLPNRTALSEAVPLSFDSLPPGVECLPGLVGRGQTVGYVAFRAAADAPAGLFSLPLLPRTLQLAWPVKDANREQILTQFSGPPVLGVVDQPAPVLVRAGTGEVVELVADGKVELTLKAERQPGFDDELKLKALGLIDLAKAPEGVLPAKGSEGKITLDAKALGLAPGDYGFILQGLAKTKAGSKSGAKKDAVFLVYSNPVQIRVKEAAKK